MLYVMLRELGRFVFLALCAARVRRGVLPRGGMVIASNHQSYVDPVLLGAALPRRISFMARDTLFRNPLFGRLIRDVGAFPVRRDGVGTEGLKTAVRKLKAGEAVLVFPEGTRTRDGQVGPIKDGAGLLSRMASVPVVPAAVEGTFRAWPRGRAYPLPARMRVAFGEAIPAERFRRDPDGARAELEQAIRSLHQELQDSSQRS